MFTLNLPQRKFIYPALTMLLFLLFLIHFAMAAEVAPSPDIVRLDNDITKTVNDARAAAAAAESDYLHSRSVAAAGDPVSATDLENRVIREENRLRGQGLSQSEWIDGWQNPSNNAYSNNIAAIRQDIRNITSAGAGTSAASDKALTEALQKERAADLRHNEARIKMHEKRFQEQRSFRNRVQDLESRIAGATPGSAERIRLERELSDLHKSYAESERDYERAYRDLDTAFSGGK